MALPTDQPQDLFLKLFLAHEEALRGFIRALVPGREDAREVMQDTAALLWRKFGQLRAPEDFRRWAFGVARLQAREFLRDRGRDRHVFGESVQALIERQAEEAVQSLDLRRNALEQCLAKLAPEQRSLLDAAYQSGVRIDELAVRNGLSPMALYKTLHRIRLLLIECTRRILTQEGLA
jgi:RNA polymerase sigma-70 factor (ECF subfamily)